MSLVTSAGSTPLGPWERFPTGAPRVWYQRLEVAGLAPRQVYPVELRRPGGTLTSATLRTLPARLPRRDETPLTVLLASCFCADTDQEGALNATFMHMPQRPDVKIFCGDQVYLDAPWYSFAFRVLGADELTARFTNKYWDVWAQPAGAAGCRRILDDGPNIFAADDHEFWNNAPNFAVYVMNSWTQGGRDEWWEIAKSLYHAYQAAGTVATFRVGDVSFFSLDTRLNRSNDRTLLVSRSDLQAFESWVDGLSGPGVLVVGQPMLADKAGVLGHVSDWSLANYEQYESLVRKLTRASHAVVILTGDVHFGRVAQCTLASGTQLVEVISSPTALVDPSAGGKWSAPPKRFPSFEIPGVTRLKVETNEQFGLTANHFLTAEFVAAGDFVSMTVKAWPVTAGVMAQPTEVGTLLLR